MENVISVVRVLKITGPESWVRTTLAQSLSDRWILGSGKIIEEIYRTNPIFVQTTLKPVKESSGDS